MDVVFLFTHSKNDDLEIRYSLRSIARNLPFVRKVWIFGDCPRFLSGNRAIVECVPWSAVGWLVRAALPVKNFFLQCFLMSLHPEIQWEFLLFTDDCILLDRVGEALAKRDRYLEDLSHVKNRGTGLWRDSLWRTYDLLKRFGYTGFNFETHMPMYLTKSRVFEAYRDLHDFVTEERYAGMLGPTAILNHAYRRQRFPLTLVREEGLKVGFHVAPTAYQTIVDACKGKVFLNFDDEAFCPNMQQFLAEQFPTPCCYESA